MQSIFPEYLKTPLKQKLKGVYYIKQVKCIFSVREWIYNHSLKIPSQVSLHFFCTFKGCVAVLPWHLPWLYYGGENICEWGSKGVMGEFLHLYLPSAILWLNMLFLSPIWITNPFEQYNWIIYHTRFTKQIIEKLIFDLTFIHVKRLSTSY